MAIWTLKCNGSEKSLADWGLRNVKRTQASQTIDTLTFDQPRAKALDDPLFPEGAIVELFQTIGGVKKRWFYGRAEDAAPFSSGRAAGASYTISGPWWWLENMGFRQSWKVRQSGGVLMDQFSSYCLLGSKADGFGTQQSIADQIAEAVNYAIGQGAPLAFDMTKKDGTVSLPTIFPPIRDAWNDPVATVIRKMVEWAPDIVSWFDYSTEPYPTLRMRRRDDQDEALIDLKAKLVDQWEIRPRNDLKVPGVIVYYIRSDSANGSVYTVINEDKFPAEVTGREPKALLAAINLEGANVTYLEAPIVCPTILPYDTAWWGRHQADLQAVTELKIEPGSAAFVDENGATIANPLPNELFGQWAPWMGGNAQAMTVSARASWKEKAKDSSDVITVVGRTIFAAITATNLITGTYHSAPGGVSGELQPIGLAAALYAACSVLHFDGRLSMTEDQCSQRVSLGQVLNLDNGRTEWKTMRAQVQSITEDIDSGKTSVVFGPPKHLGPADYIELLRATRNRIRFALPESRSTGIAGSSSAVLGQTVSKQVATQLQGGVIQQTWFDPSHPLTPAAPVDLSGKTPGRANLDIRELDGKTASWVEVERCIKGELWAMMVFGTAPYKK